MSVICRAYTTHADAAAAVDVLLAAGIAGGDVRVLMGQAPMDARTAPEGEFAGSVAPGAAVGGFAGDARRHDAGSGAFAGMAATQRGGSFADADREVITSYPEGVGRMRVAGHRDIDRMLLDAGLDRATAARDAQALHEGRILVLAAVGERDADALRAQLDG